MRRLILLVVATACGKVELLTPDSRIEDAADLHVTVTRAGSGTGTVTSSPTGVDCGATCSATFAAETSITLTAAADPGSYFMGWDGACSGTDPCTPPTDSGDITAQATFATCPGAGMMSFASTGAVQTFVVPPCTTSLVIDGFGAQGGGSFNGGGGLGAQIQGTFTVTPGDTLSIVVGQMGLLQVGGNVQNSSGGGGGTFVYTTTTLLLAAGGGGGKCNYTNAAALCPGAAGQITTSGSASCNGTAAGGVNGNGGAAGMLGANVDGGGGTGWLMPGADAIHGGEGVLGNWAGGAGYCGGGGGGCGGVGGFGGGGGGGNDYGGGGGGGGYSGGGGGNDPTHGGGGGSFNGGTAQSNTAGARSGDGQVTLTW